MTRAWHQISRRFMILARLPEGMTAQEALLRAALATPSACAGAEEWVEKLGDVLSGDQYLRVFAPPEDRVTLSPCEFAAWRRLGGGMYPEGDRPVARGWQGPQ